jgi:hypothetical protein
MRKGSHLPLRYLQRHGAIQIHKTRPGNAQPWELSECKIIDILLHLVTGSRGRT